MVNHGEELLDHAFDGKEQEQEFGVHLWHLLLKLEIYREHVDNFTAAVRKKYGMPQLKIRKDLNELRTQAYNGILEIQEDIKELSLEDQMKYLDEEIAAPINREGFSSQR